ncbi:hypothetical protein [Phaeodactylibacter xiamenensis]|uniref:hypothetical protein n=1 Tax=Phaeodactylibacter xiamenensis TaxID=1524460 RepID=UPI003BA8D9B4
MKVKIISLFTVFFLCLFQANAQGGGDIFLGISGGTFLSSLKNKGFFISENKSNVGLSIGADFENYISSGLSWGVKFNYYNSAGGQLNYSNINNITLLNDDIPFEFRTSSGDTDIRYFIDYLEFIGSIKLNIVRYSNMLFFIEPHIGIMHPINAEGSINGGNKIDVIPSIGFDIFHGGFALGTSFPLGKTNIFSSPKTFFICSLQYRFTFNSNILYGRNIVIDTAFDNSNTSMNMFGVFVGVKRNIGNINILKGG